MPAERSDRIEELYHAARQREPAERASFLEKACSGDEGLRREIESLLAQDTGVRSFLETPPLEVVRKISGEDASQSMIGRQIGSYSILSLLAKGGMGEVYCARDTKLGRDVALKILPTDFACDPERLARFRREARLLASLNHPHIAAIYGMEESGGVHCLVMELVPGETLAGTGPLPLEKALTICRQIAEGLEEAHRKNITHRDIKPANIKVTPEGVAKILDFGLAKVLAWEQSQVDLSELPTASAVATEEGRILGTPGYMSPEQVRGKAVDKQTDIWAFGCVLYELLTGKHAFQRQTLTDTIAAVLEREPDWQALPLTTPTSVQELLRRCLQKDKDRRLRDIGDARIEIEEALVPSAAPGASAPPGILGLGSGRRRTMLAGLACVIAAILASFATWNLKPSSPVVPHPISRFEITLPAGQRLAGPDQPVVALSPDGKTLVYAASGEGAQQLYLRPMDSMEAKPIPGTQEATTPFFSPDGQWVGFIAGGKLQKVSIRGGPPAILNDGVVTGGASWGDQGIIAFTPRPLTTVAQIRELGGPAQPLTHVDIAETHRWPFLTGRTALFFASSVTPNSWINAQLEVQAIQTGSQRKLNLKGTYPEYAPTGHLTYVQEGTLMAAPFDLRRLALTGEAIPVLDGILQSQFTGAAHYSFSTTGSLVYVPGGFQRRRTRLVWVDRNGAEQPLGAADGDYYVVRISPDGKRVALGIGDGIWTYDLGRETLTRLTFEGNANYIPIWTPDGKRVAFQSYRTGTARNLFWQLADGSGGLERLTATEYSNSPFSFSPDGRLLAFNEQNPETAPDIWILRLDDRKAEPFLKTRFEETGPQFSPDGRWLAYVSNESGRFEVYVQPYPGPGGKWQISTEGGRQALWNPNGRELFYREGSKMMAVDVTTEPAFSAGKPKMLFDGPYLMTGAQYPNYDVATDGKRFLMLKPVEEAQAAAQINVVLNWSSELQQRVPVK